MPSPVTDAKLLWNHRLILAALEAGYNDGTAPDAVNAIDIYDLGAPTLAGGSVDLKPIRPYFQAPKKVSTNQNLTANFWTPATGSGTAGTAPGFDPLLQAAAFAATTVTGAATVQASPPTPATGPAPTGAWTYVLGTDYAGTVDLPVTVTCTTGGASGVAKVTISAPSVMNVAAYNQANITVTNGTPLALPGGATVTPTITTPFAIGDTWTIQLTPPEATYNPISSNLQSAVLYYHLDSTRFKLTGSRMKFGCSFVAGQVPRLTFDVVGLWNPVDAAPGITPDYSKFHQPLTVGHDNTPWFSLGGNQLVMQSLTIDNQTAPVHRDRVNQKRVEIGDRPYTGKVIFDLPQRSTWDVIQAAHDNVTGALQLVHGVSAGAICGVLAPNVQLANPVLAEDNGTGITQCTCDLSFLPVSGNDELVLFFR